jgi:hypothetical protein
VNRRRYFIASVPCLALVAISRYRPVALQPRLTMAGNPERWDSIVAASGGAQRVRYGLGLDLEFIAVFAATVPPVLRKGHGGWQVAVVAAGCDTLEDVAALLLLARGGRRTAYTALRLIAVAKLAAYAATVGAVGVAAHRGR